MDETDFIGCCLANAECPKRIIKSYNYFGNTTTNSTVFNLNYVITFPPKKEKKRIVTMTSKFFDIHSEQILLSLFMLPCLTS